MKILLSVLLSIIFFSVKAQNIYNNDIKNLQELNIYGANSKVAIGQLTINPTVKSRVFIKKISQVRDTSNLYKTIFNFLPDPNTGFLRVRLQLIFNQPVENVRTNITGMYTAGFNQEKTGWEIFSTQILNDELTITVFSKTPIFTKIYGVDGQIN